MKEVIWYSFYIMLPNGNSFESKIMFNPELFEEVNGKEMALQMMRESNEAGLTKALEKYSELKKEFLQ